MRWSIKAQHNTFHKGPQKLALVTERVQLACRPRESCSKSFFSFFFFWMPGLPVCHCLSLRLWAWLYCLCQMWAGGFCLHSLSPSCQALTDKASAPRQSPLLRLRWLFLDSVPPLISSSEICLRAIGGGRVGWWGLGVEVWQWGAWGVGRGKKERRKEDVSGGEES